MILEQRDIEVKALQQALQNYREIRRRTEEANQREQALAGIEGHYQRADQAQRLNLRWLWVEQESLFNALETELEPLRAILPYIERIELVACGSAAYASAVASHALQTWTGLPARWNIGSEFRYDPPPLDDVRRRAQDQQAALPDGVKRLKEPDDYPVGLERRLRDLKAKLIRQAREQGV